MVWCYAAIVILAIIVTLLIAKIAVMKISIVEIIKKMEQKTAVETNTVIDTTSRDKSLTMLVENLNKNLERLREIELTYINGNRELRDSITNMSHDLRTPITAISAYLELIEDGDLSPKGRGYLGSIRGRVEHLKMVTEELFNFSLSISQGSDNTSPLDIGREITEIILSYQPILEQNGIEPIVSICDKKIVRNLPRDKFARVINNILSNAIKYSDGDLSMSLDDGGEIKFSNHAKGLSAVDAERLFERYFTVESGKNSTGLGLSIAKRLTEDMGGDISLQYAGDIITIKLFFKDLN